MWEKKVLQFFLRAFPTLSHYNRLVSLRTTSEIIGSFAGGGLEISKYLIYECLYNPLFFQLQFNIGSETLIN